MNVGGRAEVYADTLENTVIQGGIAILLSSINADENFVVEEDRAPVELTGSVALLSGVSTTIGYGADLQQPMIIVQQGGVLILDSSMVRGDSATFSVGNINLNGGKLWLIAGAVMHAQPKVKRLREEGAICLRTSAKEISSDFINVKGEAIGDIHAEITDTSRQILCNTLKLQPDGDGIGTALRPT